MSKGFLATVAAGVLSSLIVVVITRRMTAPTTAADAAQRGQWV